MTSTQSSSLRVRAFLRATRLVVALLLGMTLGALALAFVLAGEIYEYQDTVDGVHLPEADAIVCLAGGRGRLSAAGDLWYRYWELNHTPMVGTDKDIPDTVPVLYFSGMGRGSSWHSVTRQLRRGVIEVLKPDNLILETESGNTEANARYLARYARQHGWEKILLLTSSYHMKRARFIFERVIRDEGLELEIETLSVFQDPFEPGEWRESLHGIRVTVTEYLKAVFYRYFWKP